MFGKDILGKLAEVARCSKERIRQLVVVSYHFPDEYRYPDVPWSLYRRIVQRAKALNEDPKELLKLALDNEWSEKDIAQYKLDQTVKKYVVMNKRCENCGSIVKIRGTLHNGMVIYCPICSAMGLGVILCIVGEDSNKDYMKGGD